MIIALDYDPSAEKVAQVGYEVAKAMNASVILLHVVDEPSYYESSSYSPIMGFVGFSATDIMEADKGLQREAKRFLEESKKHLSDDSIETSVIEGDFIEALKTTIENYNADLLVMGTHSKRGIEKLILGNLAEKVLKHVNIALLAIPTKTETK